MARSRLWWGRVACDVRAQEEFDEDLQAPDRYGVLDMSHRAWAALDEKLWNWCVASVTGLCVSSRACAGGALVAHRTTGSFN